MEKLLSSFPRSRPLLSKDLADVYAECYLRNRSGQGLFNRLSQQLESWMHRQVSQVKGDTLLELGAGTLNHIAYERFSAYDVVEPCAARYRQSGRAGSVRSFFSDVGDIAGRERYDKIASVAVLEHVSDLPDCIARCALLLKENGCFQAGIPSEGGFLWGLAWRFSTGLSFRISTGLDYGELMRHEHLNEAPDIIALVRYFFRHVKLRRFPLPLHHWSLYVYLEAKDPNIERCENHLQRVRRKGNAEPS